MAGYRSRHMDGALTVGASPFLQPTLKHLQWHTIGGSHMLKCRVWHEIGGCQTTVPSMRTYRTCLLGPEAWPSLAIGVSLSHGAPLGGGQFGGETPTIWSNTVFMFNNALTTN